MEKNLAKIAENHSKLKQTLTNPKIEPENEVLENFLQTDHAANRAAKRKANLLKMEENLKKNLVCEEEGLEMLKKKVKFEPVEENQFFPLINKILPILEIPQEIQQEQIPQEENFFNEFDQYEKEQFQKEIENVFLEKTAPIILEAEEEVKIPEIQKEAIIEKIIEKKIDASFLRGELKKQEMIDKWEIQKKLRAQEELQDQLADKYLEPEQDSECEILEIVKNSQEIQEMAYEQKFYPGEFYATFGFCFGQIIVSDTEKIKENLKNDQFLREVSKGLVISIQKEIMPSIEAFNYILKETAYGYEYYGQFIMPKRKEFKASHYSVKTNSFVFGEEAITIQSRYFAGRKITNLQCKVDIYQGLIKYFNLFPAVGFKPVNGLAAFDTFANQFKCLEQVAFKKKFEKMKGEEKELKMFNEYLLDPELYEPVVKVLLSFKSNVNSIIQYSADSAFQAWKKKYMQIKSQIAIANNVNLAHIEGFLKMETVDYRLPQHIMDNVNKRRDFEQLKHWFFNHVLPKNMDKRKMVMIWSEERNWGKTCFSLGLVSELDNKGCALDKEKILHIKTGITTDVATQDFSLAKLILFDDCMFFTPQMREENELTKFYINIFSSQGGQINAKYASRDIPAGLPCIVCSNELFVAKWICSSPLISAMAYKVFLEGPLFTEDQLPQHFEPNDLQVADKESIAYKKVVQMVKDQDEAVALQRRNQQN